MLKQQIPKLPMKKTNRKIFLNRMPSFEYRWESCDGNSTKQGIQQINLKILTLKGRQIIFFKAEFSKSFITFNNKSFILSYSHCFGFEAQHSFIIFYLFLIILAFSLLLTMGNGRLKYYKISMFRKDSKATNSSRFKEQRPRGSVKNTTMVRYKTEGGEREEQHWYHDWTARNKSNLVLEQFVKQGTRQRRMFLQTIFQPYRPSSTPHCPSLRVSCKQKENIRKNIIKAVTKDSNILTTANKGRRRRIQQRGLLQNKHKYSKKYQCIKSSFGKIEAHSATLKGNKSQINQDAISYSQGIYVVCDGHGNCGMEIARTVVSLAHKLIKQAVQESKLDTNFLQGFNRKVEEQLEQAEIDAAFSGSTMIAVVIQGSLMHCINVGDSRAIICRGLKVSQLNIAHKPDLEGERKRIERFGGVIHPLEIGRQKFVGPNRIWAPGRSSWGPGLALSRAFGDFASRKYGVTSEPETKIFHLSSEDGFIILGSDGLFDYVKDSELCAWVRRWLGEEIPKEEIPMRLAEQARRVSSPQSDDISCIIIFL